MEHDLVCPRNPLQIMALMACLSSRFLPTFLSQALRSPLEPVGRRRFAASMAIFCHLLLQLLDQCFQLGHSLFQCFILLLEVFQFLILVHHPALAVLLSFLN